MITYITNLDSAYGVRQLVADTEEDIDNFPIDGRPGSTVYVILTKKTYILNGKGEWVEKEERNDLLY